MFQEKNPDNKKLKSNPIHKRSKKQFNFWYKWL